MAHSSTDHKKLRSSIDNYNGHRPTTLQLYTFPETRSPSRITHEVVCLNVSTNPNPSCCGNPRSTVMQASGNAYDLFPADQFDAWVDGVRAKIIDGLERQHVPDKHEIRVPELSSQALEAINLARREAEINRQAGPSSSYSRINVSESYELEGEEALADETVIIETHRTVVTRQRTRYPPSEQDDNERDDADEDDNDGYLDETMENDGAQGTYLLRFHQKLAVTLSIVTETLTTETKARINLMTMRRMSSVKTKMRKMKMEKKTEKEMEKKGTTRKMTKSSCLTTVTRKDQTAR
jgi:hypothetical protein